MPWLFFQTLPAQTPQEVKVGMHLMNLYDLNMDEYSFYADFYLWFKWKGEIDPTEIEFVNAIEKWSITSVVSGDGSDSLMRDSTNYRVFRVEGRFFHSFSLGDFPLDHHALDIQIENPEHDSQTLVYVADTAGASIRKTLQLVGWDIDGCSFNATDHDYGTNFGNPDENARAYSNLTCRVLLSRPINYFLLKMLLPILIVMLVSIGSMLLHPSHIDTRSSLPIGGLLTAVFLQQSYSNALPDTGYMVLMDKIYLLAYLLISLVLLQVIRSGNWLMRENRLPEARLIRMERRLAAIYLGVFVVAVVVMSVW
ncbi:MAG: hypothetical protein ACKVU2_05660 [Saprospiraceae bacterium]